MSDYSTTASVELTVNGAKAKQELERQKKLVDDLTAAYARAAAAGDKSTMKQLHKDLTQARKGLRTMQSDIKNVEDVLRRLDKATPKELENTLSKLRVQLKGMERGTSAWDAQVEKIRAVKKELDNIKDEIKSQETARKRITRVVARWQMMIVEAAKVIINFVSARFSVN